MAERTQEPPPTLDPGTLQACLEEEREARQAVEAAYRRTLAESRLLYEAGNLLGSTLELDQIYAYLRDLISGCMECTGLIVSRYDAESEMIGCSYAWVEGVWLDPAGFPAIPLAVEGRGRQSTVIRSGRPLMISDTDSPDYASTTEYHVDIEGNVRDLPEREKPRTRSLMMVPIKLEGRVLGIVQVQCHSQSAYTEDDLRLLEALVLQMAAAERNAFLYRRAKEEIEERVRAEEALREQQSEVRELNERLRRAMVETHHRVKNNLQIIAAMIDLQIAAGRESVPRTEIERMAGQINTLGLVHDLLTQDAKQEGMAAALPAAKLIGALLELMRRVAEPLVIEAELGDFNFPTRQATALALAANELVSNAIKHAKGRIGVVLRSEEDGLLFQVEDDGPGFPPDFSPTRSRNTGLDLVEHITSWDLGGSVTYRTSSSGGALVKIRFPEPAVKPGSVSTPQTH